LNLGFLLLTDQSEAINGKVYVLGGGWNMLQLPELPQEWGFGIAFGLDVPWNDTNRPHSLSLRIEDPDGEMLGDEFSVDFETGRPPGLTPGQDQRIVTSLGARTTFASAGPHAVVIQVGDKEVGRTRFYVQLSPRPVSSS